MVAAGGLSGGLSSTIAGGNFWQGFRQGIITSGLNHMAHMAAAYIEQRNMIKDKIDNYYKNKITSGLTVTESFLEVLQEIFPDIFAASAKDFAVANEENLTAYNKDTGAEYKLVGRKLVGSDGKNVNGITSMGNGKVLIAPFRMRTAMSFANTWIHEAIIHHM